MKILGITAEYNPFHNGHKYHLEKSLEVTGADYSVAVMSGNFTQRGEAALLDKWTRSRIAVENGIDLVVELPFVFACSRGESFARGAVDILEGLGATHIAFGSETGDTVELEALACELSERAEELEDVQRAEMEKGESFVRSYSFAAEKILGSEKAEMMRLPNNILALEYLKRIRYWRERGHVMEPAAVRRYGSGYRSIDEKSGFAGASILRMMLEEGKPDYDQIGKYGPANTAEAVREALISSEAEERAFTLLRSEIVKKSSSELSEIYCMGEGLENKFKKEIIKAGSIEEFVSAVVSRRYTEAAIRRLIVYVLMGIRETHPEEKLYARVLAAGRGGRELLKLIKNRTEGGIPVITNINKERDLCLEAGETLRYDILASDIYSIIAGRGIYDFSDKVKRPYMG